jgi:hypothetical protein
MFEKRHQPVIPETLCAKKASYIRSVPMSSQRRVQQRVDQGCADTCSGEYPLPILLFLDAIQSAVCCDSLLQGAKQNSVWPFVDAMARLHCFLDYFSSAQPSASHLPFF